MPPAPVAPQPDPVTDVELTDAVPPRATSAGASAPAPRTPPPPRGAEEATDVVDPRNFGPPPLRDGAPGAAETQYRPSYPGNGAPPSAAEVTQQWGPEMTQQWSGEPPRRPPPRDAGPASGPIRSADAAPPAAGPWAGQPAASAPAGSPSSFSYVDNIRSSELVPTRKIPPRSGWRRAVYKGTFGAINPGQSPDERRLAELEAKIRSLLRGRYKIGVLGKGGAGKTTIAAGVGSIFAELRQDDRVVAIDADPAFGMLGLRIDPNARGTYWELAADRHLNTFSDMRSRVGNNSAGLFVLSGEQATARRRLLNPRIYREATAQLDKHFTISIIDCGATLDSPVTQEVLRDLDALIVVSSLWYDGASATARTLEWLANYGHTALLHRTVVALNNSDSAATKQTRAVLREEFSSRGQVVVEVPFDRHLRPGGVIDVRNDIEKVTRRRFIEIAAAIAEHFPATTDGPRERR